MQGFFSRYSYKLLIDIAWTNLSSTDLDSSDLNLGE